MGSGRNRHGLFENQPRHTGVKRFTPLTYSYSVGYGSSTEFAITNEGQHVAVVGGYNSNLGSRPGFRLYDIPNDCGDIVTNGMTSATPVRRQCPSGSFESILKDNYSQNVDEALSPSFDDGGGQLTVKTHTANDVKPATWVQLTVDEYTPLPDITYLALGDSYSSGEGDTTANGAHYLPGNGVKGDCHISDRSYPFLLRDNYDISSDNMESIACSGAQVAFDYMGDDTNYIGQNRQLKGLSAGLKYIKRQAALKNFTPGIVKQTDFVKKYKPAVITLTGGGNDVGFANILEYCASPHKDDFISIIHQSCDYIRDGSELHTMLYDSIDSQYSAITLLIQKIREASPNSRIIIVGYPSFISAGTSICNPNAGLLDSNERAMITKALNYMNEMLKRVAVDNSVSYVDIKDSLAGGRICEGGKYVTGAWDGLSGRADDSERFHPNALGHIKIAETIEDSGVFKESEIPEVSSYSPNPDAILTLPFTFIKGVVTKVMQTLEMSADSNMFMSGTSVSSTMHSDPINLGTYKANTDGSFSATIPTDNLPVGQHVLVIEGIGPNGKPVRYYQYVYITEGSELVQDDKKSKSTQLHKSGDIESDRPQLAGTSTSRINSKTIALFDDSSPPSRTHTAGPLRSSQPSPRSARAYTNILLIAIITGGIAFYVKQRKNQ